MGSIRSKRESPSQRSSTRLFEEVILKSWWTILFFLVCYFAYDQAIHRKSQIEKALYTKLRSIEKEKGEALLHQEDLKLHISSQNDEGFIELTLMKRLGLVPEGQRKVHFIQTS